jgi:hypothetical protein
MPSLEGRSCSQIARNTGREREIIATISASNLGSRIGV